MMLKLGFNARWVDLIMKCVSTVRYFISHKSKDLGPIHPERGLHQGDPISPYLFIFCVEGLSCFLNDMEIKGLIHECRIARGEPPISQLFFALFFRANLHECGTIKYCLQVYESASGQQINLSKSVVSFSPNVHDTVKEELCETLEVENTAQADNYLGFPTRLVQTNYFFIHQGESMDDNSRVKQNKSLMC